MTKYRDTICGVAVIVISIVLFIATFGIQEFTRTTLGAGFIPRITAAIFAILGIVLILRERRRNRLAALEPPTPKATEPAEKPVGLVGPLPVALNIILFVIYLLFLERVGFIIMTAAYLFLQILLITNPAKYRFGRFAVLSVVVSVTSYYLFVNIFYVMLPSGILG